MTPTVRLDESAYGRPPARVGRRWRVRYDDGSIVTDVWGDSPELVAVGEGQLRRWSQAIASGKMTAIEVEDRHP